LWVGGGPIEIAMVWVPSLTYVDRLSLISSSSPWQIPVKAIGKNTSSTFFAPRKELSVTRRPF
jgi:hypothetical protein